jgi:hypothetical protein
METVGGSNETALLQNGFEEEKLLQWRRMSTWKRFLGISHKIHGEGQCLTENVCASLGVRPRSSRREVWADRIIGVREAISQL